LRPLSLDVRGPAVAQLDRHLDELKILEVPAPPRVDAHAGDDSPIWYAGRRPALSCSCGLELPLANELHSKRFAGNTKGDDRGFARRRGPVPAPRRNDRQ